jgi:hypothetical protein
VIKWRNGRLKRLLAEVAAGSRSSRVERMRAREKYEARRELSILLAGYCAGAVYPRGGDAFFRRLCASVHTMRRDRKAPQ